jgi:hypothetical protein
MSLIGVIRNAIDGKETWSDVGSKIEALFVEDVVDPGIVWGKQFLSDFGKATLVEAAKYGPQLLANPSSIGTLIPTIATDLEQQGIKIAETDALQDASTIIGNALRTQLTADQIQAAAPTQSSASSDPVPDSAQPAQ